MDKKIFIVTNRKLIKAGNLNSVVKDCISGGANTVILREKDLSSQALYELAEKIDKRIPIIINGDYEVAKKINATGLHLKYSDFMSFKKDDKMKVGVSVHSLEEAKVANKTGADYILAGHIFNTKCKEGLEGRGLDFLKKICSAVKIPVIAIGGINTYNVKSVINTGAAGVAVMSSAMEAIKPGEYIKTLKKAMNE